jgi:fumarate reductase subunit D
VWQSSQRHVTNLITALVLLLLPPLPVLNAMHRRVHTVLYEDLVAHPELVARELLSVCGLGWEQGVLQFQATDRPVHTASMVQVGTV